ncbi:hypothetical protein [Nocardia pneumoniae]|uniref:hypothetical protein n=1 Tax=Nocardia pneumoniae TaxID=228601 RepID=UPI0012F6798B|nr:hypothetical protein [Nocardia pneumoniae]
MFVVVDTSGSAFEQARSATPELLLDERLCGLTDPVHVHLELVSPGEFTTEPANEVLVAGEINWPTVLVAQYFIGGRAGTAVPDVAEQAVHQGSGDRLPPDRVAVFVESDQAVDRGVGQTAQVAAMHPPRWYSEIDWAGVEPVRVPGGR